MEVRFAAVKSLCKRSFKEYFSDVYRTDNHMAYYNFCHQCKDQFTSAGAKGPNYIFFVVSFF